MYHLVFGILYLVSLLPFRVLYVLSDLFYLLLYRIIKYRKAVVMENLLYAFPEKTEIEREKIAAKFYRNFMDNWIETVKLISISRSTLNKRATGNYEILYQLFPKGKAVQADFGHFFNWELMALHTVINQPYTLLAVYYPQRSKISDRLMKYIRGRFGNPLIPSDDMIRSILPWRKKQYMLGLGADQGTPFVENAYWMYFLNRPAGFVKGPEKFARGQNIPVVTMTTTKPRRGYYHFDFFLLADEPRSLPEGELIRRYVRHLENNVRLQPEIYLWSHRRWKRGWKPEYENLWIDTVPAPAETTSKQ